MTQPDRPSVCPDCGAELIDASGCIDQFHQMLHWEWEHQMMDVHHLMVLCYYLQHPHLYSPEGLRGAMTLLGMALEQALPPQELRRRLAPQVESGVRDYPIRGTARSAGRYATPVQWTMTAADVVAAGPAQYEEHVRRWADSVLAALRESGEMPSTEP